MNKVMEPTPQEIKDKRIYAEWGLTDEEYSLISEKILNRLPNYTETGLFSVMWSEHCSYKNSNLFYVNSQRKVNTFYRDQVKVLGLSISAMAKQLFLKRKVITIHQQ